jgi:GNAT superfamily N-acetyltransferase
VLQWEVPVSRGCCSLTGGRQHGALRLIGYELRMTQDVVIRPAHEGDRDFVVGLVPGLLQFGSPAWRDPDALRSGFGDVLAGALSRQDDRATVLIAQTGDETSLGFISLNVVDSIEGGERAHVADLAVTEDARRMGVGTALMRAGEAWAHERGFQVLSLDVWSTNDAASRFYHRLGYTAESSTLFKRLD